MRAVRDLRFLIHGATVGCFRPFLRKTRKEEKAFFLFWERRPRKVRGCRQAAGQGRPLPIYCLCLSRVDFNRQKSERLRTTPETARGHSFMTLHP